MNVQNKVLPDGISLSASSLIHALKIHPYEIMYRVAVPKEINIVEESVKFDLPEVKDVDVKPLIIAALNQIDEAETRARQATDELERYKQEHRDFELFKKFKEKNNL